MKTCSRCHETKELSSFRFLPSARRHDSYCLVCRTAANREYRASAGNRQSARRVRRVAEAAATQARRFGVEFEILVPSVDRLVAELRARGIAVAVERYNHSTRSHWKLTTDASVRGAGFQGRELVSPVLRGADGFDQVRRVGEALAAAGAKVNMTCGTHVHHDAADLTAADLAALAALYAGNQSVIDGMVAPSRRASARNIYCASYDATEAARVARCTTVAEVARVGRYRTLNFAALAVHGTVEFRQHQGTTSAAKISAWIRFGQAMIEAARSRRVIAAGSVADLVTALDTLSAEEAAMLCRRADVLARRSAARAF